MGEDFTGEEEVVEVMAGIVGVAMEEEITGAATTAEVTVLWEVEAMVVAVTAKNDRRHLSSPVDLRSPYYCTLTKEKRRAGSCLQPQICLQSLTLRDEMSTVIP